MSEKPDDAPKKRRRYVYPRHTATEQLTDDEIREAARTIVSRYRPLPDLPHGIYRKIAHGYWLHRARLPNAASLHTLSDLISKIVNERS